MALREIDKALDEVYSLWIRCANKWKCQVCGLEFNPPKKMRFIGDEAKRLSFQLHCSHFWGKGSSGVWTRWNPMCADALCMFCHTKYEKLKGPAQEYRLQKIQQLGQEMFFYMEWLSKRNDPMYPHVKEFRLFELISLVLSAKYRVGWMCDKYEGLLPMPLPYHLQEALENE